MKFRKLFKEGDQVREKLACGCKRNAKVNTQMIKQFVEELARCYSGVLMIYGKERNKDLT